MLTLLADPHPEVVALEEYILWLKGAIVTLSGAIAWLVHRLVAIVKERDKERVDMIEAREAEIRELRKEKSDG